MSYVRMAVVSMVDDPDDLRILSGCESCTDLQKRCVYTLLHTYTAFLRCKAERRLQWRYALLHDYYRSRKARPALIARVVPVIVHVGRTLALCKYSSECHCFDAAY